MAAGWHHALFAQQQTDSGEPGKFPGAGRPFCRPFCTSIWIPGWDNLSLDQKKLVYYLTEAGYSGRDIIYDQNCRYNLTIRHALEHIVANYTGDRTSKDWDAFMTCKRVWFSNRITIITVWTRSSLDFSAIISEIS